MAVLPGAEPFSFEGSGDNARTGVLVVHGFTGSPQSVRPWAEHLNAAGYAVEGPLLPGHGTRWQDMNACTWEQWFTAADKALGTLRKRVDEVFVVGLSMGATLTTRLAEQHHDIKGIVLVNVSLATQRKDAKLLPLFKGFVPSFPGIASDIKKPDTREVAYDRLPLKAAWQLQQLWRVVRADLDKIVCPVLYYRSRVDHVVEAVSGEILLAGLTSTTATEVVLEESYHVATLDNDAPRIFSGTVDFIRENAGRPVAANGA